MRFVLFLALLADQGIDDDSALKISNMAALPDGMPPGSNAAIKAKISSAHAQQGKSAGPSQASQSSQGSPAGYDPNAYLYDANSWPEYTIHDSDYSNFRSVEMNNMNGENTDMPIYKPNRRPGMAGYPNMGNEEGMEYQGQKFPQDKEDGSQFNDEFKQENGEASQKKPFNDEGKQENGETSQKKPFNDEAKQEKGEALQQKPKSEGSPLSAKDQGIISAAGDAKLAADSGSNGIIKSESNSKQALAPAQQSPQAAPGPKAEGNAPTAKDAASPQQQQQQQQQPQAKAIPAKLAESVAQAAASLPPKTIASLVSSLVSGGKAVGTTAGKVLGQGQGQDQGQKNVAGAVPQSLIPQDINPAVEQTQGATQLHKVAKPKKP